MLNFEEYQKIQKECLELSRKKNHDYGDENLKKFGEIGIIIRMSDKMDRLINLQKVETPKVEESIEDTAKDMINYATYLIMMQRGVLNETINK